VSVFQRIKGKRIKDENGKDVFVEGKSAVIVIKPVYALAVQGSMVHGRVRDGTSTFSEFRKRGNNPSNYSRSGLAVAAEPSFIP
jgi:hypothetical protein